MEDRIAKTETYAPRLKQAMIDAYDAGERNLKARFGLDILKKSHMQIYYVPRIRFFLRYFVV